ncbi:anti-phage-associated DUF1156 domain-containing protein [Exiguobacterium sp. K1]|uniref:anti-phage-associated DUF1156 domain-containing protein n=1 Tax=Exiguobacterium sp. K1 TaxID=2980105 RepID=UPI00299CFF8A|nr:anti-phage-associated DUF1156 domain-containing protein [Exiguobacterium sp. K1]MDX1260710.1 DUF1156 domain-containing protein [Exiguobacterium sp. K1]
MLDYSKSFIETQFPVSKISKESYKERKANLGQTLTGLGKWWGRKPLILVRATMLGVLLPVSDNPKKDREIFLKLLTMDEEGLLLRKSKNLPLKKIFSLLNFSEKTTYFSSTSTEEKPVLKKGVTTAEKKKIQKIAFARLSYDEKLTYCDRPEHVEEIPENVWNEVNDHLDTSVSNIQELVEELGNKRFGHKPRIGDAFAGGGSIPFESARIGADVYASDLNPVAALLTWSALNIAGASANEIETLKKFQTHVYDVVDKKIVEWGLEHNEYGERADSYLYCIESNCPECGYKVPLAPSWVIGQGTKTVALLRDNNVDGFEIEIIQNASDEEILKSKSMSTVQQGKLKCPHCKKETPIAVLRKDRRDADGNTISGLRKWEKNDFLPEKSDVFQERLFCIRYVKENVDKKGNKKIERYYTKPSIEDLKREQNVINKLSERIDDWKVKGYIPTDIIEEGYNTNQPVRERGWQYWHQLFNPRQLIIIGLFVEEISEGKYTQLQKATGLLGINKFANFNSKLSMWVNSPGVEKVVHVFTNQALNTFYNYGTRPLIDLKNLWNITLNASFELGNSEVQLSDAREVNTNCDIWITDPPYADAVNYHELTEFFLSWDKLLIKKEFKDWYTDSKRVLAVKGKGKEFNESMIDVYRNLSQHMPDNGTQVVMFTHQDVKVWAELAMILWSSGLRVVSAWNIATETDASGLKQGNYVKGTVLLVLKKQTSDDVAFQDELYQKIKKEVQFQIDSMRDLDDKEDPNFTDADYLLASYASSLKILTSYRDIEGIDVKYELSRTRNSSEEGPIESIINKAVKIAFDYLIPESFDNLVWRELSAEERFFIRSLELEMGNVYQISAYQELARGFSISNYRDMFENFRANKVRLKTASEYRTKGIDKDIFGNSLMRNILVSLHLCVQSESTLEGKNYLKAKYDQGNEYWNKRSAIIEILGFVSRFEKISHMQHWHKDSYYARLLKESIRNDGV